MNFSEVALGYDLETAALEASRCLNCKNRPCVGGCPVGIEIPDFIRKIKERNPAEAVKIIKRRNMLPAICGRVCPQEQQCEKACVLNKLGDPVAIGRLERFAGDWEADNETTKVGKASSTGRRAAVVGSGPAGLTAASELARLGHSVTIFEAFQRPGGVLLYGIPAFRLPKVIVEREIEKVKALGVEILTNQILGKTFSIDDLFKRGYHSIFIGVGAGPPSKLNIPGDNLECVYSANDYLRSASLLKARADLENMPLRQGRKVLVIGGGNVAMDAARTAVRLGAEMVTIAYRRSRAEMPARQEEIEITEEEGVKLDMLVNPVKIIGDDEGRVRAVQLIKMQLGDTDESGRPRPMPISGSDYIIDVDTVIVAAGAGYNPLFFEPGGVQTNKWGYIITDPETGLTSRPGVYAGGDIVTGAATVIQAMGAGLRSARSMHQYMMNLKKN